jgi:hypothetical protein
VSREVARLNETSSWPLLSKGANGFVSSFGELTNLKLNRSLKRLELAPYLVSEASVRTAEPGNPFSKNITPAASIGVDARYALTPGLTLAAAVNPDFGQVEADPAVVNLTAFETFFGERRPFFVEGSGVFRFDLECNDGQCTGLFYSRRIGRSPQGSVDVPEGGYQTAPAQTTILGATKLTGRVGGFSIGALNAVTSEESASLAYGSSRSRHVVEPLTSYSVMRARKEFADQSSFGIMATATNRRLEDGVRFLPNHAYTGGIDWDWRLRKAYSVNGYWSGSSVGGSEAAIDRLQRNNVHGFQRPDAGYLDYDPSRTELAGHSGMLAFSKIAGDRIRFNTNGGFRTPGFDVNDVGYLRRADYIWFSNWLQWRHDKPSKHFRNMRFNFNQWNGWNFGGDTLSRGGNVNAHFVFTSDWRTGAGITVNGATLQDRATRGGPAALNNGFINVWHYVASDSRRAAQFELQNVYGTDRHGSRVYEVNPMLIFRPSSALSISGGLGMNRRVEESQWIGKVTGEAGRESYVFGRMAQTTISLRTRVNYTVTPTLSIQLYAEPFVSAAGFDGFKELVDGRALQYEHRFASFGYRGNPDFNYKSLRTTNVLRWEYRPGSALFIVWQQGREERTANGDFRFGRDFGDIFGSPANNVFLVKLSYWLNR